MFFKAFLLGLICASLFFLFFSSSFSSAPSPSIFRNRKVLIVGGGSGIGAQMAKDLSNFGAKIFLTGRRADRLAAVCDSIFTHTNRSDLCFFGEFDAADPKDCVSGVESAVQKLGGELDFVILAQAWGRVSNFMEVPKEQLFEAYRSTFDANWFGCACVLRHAIPYLLNSSLVGTKLKPGVLYMGSSSTYYGIGKMSFYSSSKLSVVPLLKALSLEVPQIAFTSADIGFVATDWSSVMPEKALASAQPVDKASADLIDAMLTQNRYAYLPMIYSPYIPGKVAYYASVLMPSLFEKLMHMEYGTFSFLKDVVLPHPMKKKEEEEGENKKKQQ